MNSLLQTLYHVLSLRRAVYDMPTEEENRCVFCARRPVSSLMCCGQIQPRQGGTRVHPWFDHCFRACYDVRPRSCCVGTFGLCADITFLQPSPPSHSLGRSVVRWDIPRFRACRVIYVAELGRACQSQLLGHLFTRCVPSCLLSKRRSFLLFVTYVVEKQRYEHGAGSPESFLPAADQQQERGHEGAHQVVRVGHLRLLHAAGV